MHDEMSTDKDSASHGTHQTVALGVLDWRKSGGHPGISDTKIPAIGDGSEKLAIREWSLYREFTSAILPKFVHATSFQFRHGREKHTHAARAGVPLAVICLPRDEHMQVSGLQRTRQHVAVQAVTDAERAHHYFPVQV